MPVSLVQRFVVHADIVTAIRAQYGEEQAPVPAPLPFSHSTPGFMSQPLAQAKRAPLDFRAAPVVKPEGLPGGLSSDVPSPLGDEMPQASGITQLPVIAILLPVLVEKQEGSSQIKLGDYLVNKPTKPEEGSGFRSYGVPMPPAE